MKKYTKKEQRLIGITLMTSFVWFSSLLFYVMIPGILNKFGVITWSEKVLMVFVLLGVLLLVNHFGYPSKYFFSILNWMENLDKDKEKVLMK